LDRGYDLDGVNLSGNSEPLSEDLPEVGRSERTTEHHSDDEKLDTPNHDGKSCLRLE
jgi:hypothetical protein